MKTGKKLLSIIITLALILGVCIITSADEPQATLEGTPKVGNTLTVVSDIEYVKFDWYRKVGEEFAFIVEASGSSYTLQPDDLGLVIYVNTWLSDTEFGTQVFTAEPVADADSVSQEDPTSAPDENSTTPGDNNSVFYLVALSLLSLLGIVVYKKKSILGL